VSVTTVVGRGSLLAAVFQNLLANGLKFVAKDQPLVIHVSSTDSAEEVLIEFQDNGIGIPPEDEERIFEPFVRLHRKQEFDGSGLGLTQVRKIVEAHEGSRSVSPSPGGQATRDTFQVALPKPPLPR
jgi:signal transduction histidine kinase